MGKRDNYEVEWTDTFGGEANYCWVKRVVVRASSLAGAMRIARRRWGITGTRGTFVSFGDMAEWRPRGICQVIFARWRDA